MSIIYNKKTNTYWLKTSFKCCLFEINQNYYKLNNSIKIKLDKNEKQVFNLKAPFSNQAELVLENMNELLKKCEHCKNEMPEIANIIKVENLTTTEIEYGFKCTGAGWCKIVNKKLKDNNYKKVLRFLLFKNDDEFEKYIDIPLNISIKNL